MSSYTLSQIGPSTTPPSIKHLIIWTCVLSLASAIIQSIFDQFGITPGPQQLLSLSWWGIGNWYLWQPLTYLFIQPYSSAGVTFFSLISLFLTMYMLWVLGTAIYELVGKTAFLRFYFFCGIVTGLIAFLIMPLVGKYAMLAGPSAAILALLTAWSMAYPESEVLLFFLIPVKAKWIMAGLLGAILLITLSQWDIANLFLYMASTLVGYTYACIAWGWHSPFSIMQKMDSFLSAVGLKMRRFFVTPKWLKFKENKSSVENKETKQSHDKTIDIRTGAPTLSDDAFIDEMLAKISKHGEGSLSWGEHRRMQQISERKRKENEK